MLYVKISGGLGNILFQVSAALSVTQDITIIVLKDSIKKTLIYYKEAFFLSIPSIDYIPFNIKVYRCAPHHYSKIPYIPNEDLLIEGYFQSYKYFDKHALDNLIKIPLNVEQKIKSLYINSLKKETVSINVRRGDYLKLPHRHPFCGFNYYKKCINYFQGDFIFIVSSDDIKWCKKKFCGENFIFVEHDNFDPFLDLWIQTFCDNNIISNSTFSWWGAYLNKKKDKKVLYPSLWYGLELRKVDTNDFFPNGYIKIGNRYSCFQFVQALFLVLKTILSKLLRPKLYNSK